MPVSSPWPWRFACPSKRREPRPVERGWDEWPNPATRGSDSVMVDRKTGGQRSPRPDTPPLADGFEAVPVIDRLRELCAPMSLSKSRLARILRVNRLTIYEWYEGKEPNSSTSERIRTLLDVLMRNAVSGARPLNARFVRQPLDFNEPSLLDLLSEDRLNEEQIACALQRVRDLGTAACRRRKDREDRLRALGFEEPSAEQRREQLARNVALHQRLHRVSDDDDTSETSHRGMRS